MKIALLTIWHEKNFGAELQAYATVKILRTLGYEIDIIDIRLSDIRRLSCKGKIVDFFMSIGSGSRSFFRFWNKNFHTTRRYKSLAEIQKRPPQADVYMVGSDQVWNPDITRDFALLYFLDFGSEKIHRISYASSFGVNTWTHDEYYNEVKSLLNRFSYISCRESSGVKLLKEKFQLESEHVLDPTLLLDDYSEFIGDIKEQDTLVYYPLSKDFELENYSVNLANSLGLTVINNNKIKKLFGRIPWDMVGIEEWIRNIAQSRFVITRSFHGLAFCLIFKRQFAILESRNGRGERLTSLLSILGLSERLYKDVAALDRARPWEIKIDYDIIDARLKAEREKSIKFLTRSLKDINL